MTCARCNDTGRVGSLLADALLKAVNGARVDAVHAPFPMVTTDLTTSQVFEGSIARQARGVLDGVTVYPVSAAVYRVEAMEVPAPAPPAKVFIAHVMETMRSSEVLGVFATRDAAVARARENGGWVTEHEVQP